MTNLTDKFPQALKQSSLPGALVYVLSQEWIAYKGSMPAELKPYVVTSIDDEKIVICQISSDAIFETLENVLPVYTTANHALTAVATGLIFVRFDDKVSAASRLNAFQQAGYCIERVPEYATNSAWLRDADAQISRALTNVYKLSEISDVVHIEPQLLMARSNRD